MARPKNPMELFVLLDKTNCRKCNEPTCLAFAAAVFQGKRDAGECPSLDPELAARFETSEPQNPRAPENDREKALLALKKHISGIDLAAAARRLGEPFEAGRLTIKVLGKDVAVDAAGNLYSDIHLHAWVAVPLLHYVLHGKGTEPGGRWVPLRELEGGRDWAPLFGQRCEKPLKRIADSYTDLFSDMLDLFAGKTAAAFRDSDIAILLRPLPKLPLLICYWRPEEGIDSELNLFFDATATENLPIGSIYTLATGLVVMFEKLALRHGLRQP